MVVQPNPLFSALISDAAMQAALHRGRIARAAALHGLWVAITRRLGAALSDRQPRLSASAKSGCARA
ncbi:hypothetical protein [Pelagibius sp.]|uniref:hypothetical protein n=1 Tax=Pelagibius sp. TaxID=1931238 RepID=UPI00260B6E39|nr:hypothetical protein [Pelagibius sp.]